jgi:PKD repeat protein
MAVTRIASTDVGYTTGSLSVYPEAKDSKYQLYEATNNSQTVLTQSLTYNGKYVIVADATGFPSNGIIRIGPPPGASGAAEMIYYDSIVNNTFQNLVRGFAGSRQNPWPIGSHVSNAVFAEHHNSIKDAIIQIETNLGTQDLPNSSSLNGILKAQETRFLAPRALFRAYPLSGPPPLTVTFQNFSTGPLVRYLWDFGDGTTSVEKSPTHTFQKEGIYSIKLNIISSLGAQGIATKSNYINVAQEEKQPFFYVEPSNGVFYSQETADKKGIDPTTFNFVDQTDGDIIQRYWVFDDSDSITELNPNKHTISYVYKKPGVKNPTLLILFENQTLKRAFLRGSITVL